MAIRKKEQASKQNVEKVDLFTFFAVQARLENWDHIPEIHVEMLEFLLKEDEWNDSTAVLQMFRNAAKSTLTAIWVVWKLTQDPTKIFLIQSADDGVAQKMVADIARVIRTNPYSKHLEGKSQTWSARALGVRGGRGGRNDSVSARGIMSNVTGARADYILFDDVEVMKNCATEDLRDKLRARISEATHLLNPEGKRLFIGTPHTAESIYVELIESGASSLKIPIIKSTTGEFPNMTGIPSWPERWPLKKVFDKQRRCKSVNEFYSQYLLIPTSLDDTVLDPTKAHIYEGELEIKEANGSQLLTLNERVMSNVIAFWDVSLGKTTGDASVISIVFASKDGTIFIHRVYEVKGEIQQQCQAVRELIIRYSLPAIYVEVNGIGNFVPDILQEHLKGLNVAVIREFTKQNKTQSIIEAYEIPLSGGFVYVSKQVSNSKWATQLRDFNPRFPKGKDDFIDSPAKAIHLLPTRYAREAKYGETDFTPWRKHETTIEAPLDPVVF